MNKFFFGNQFECIIKNDFYKTNVNNNDYNSFHGKKAF